MSGSAVRIGSIFPGGFQYLLHVQDQKATGTDGGTFTSGAWRQRVLNTVLVNQITGASLSANQITLAEGDYFAMGSATAYDVDTNQLRLYDTTNTTTLLTGLSVDATSVVLTSSSSSVAHVNGWFSLPNTAVIELEHYCQTTNSGDGFGRATSFSTDHEVYSDLLIWKLP